MPLPRWLTLCGRGTHACACGICTILLWTSWLLLAITLAIQLVIASVREVAVPRFVLRQVEERLAMAGLQARFGQARFDPAGHVLLHDVAVMLGTGSDPLLRAETVLLRIDPWALLLRDVEVRSITFSGSELFVPAMFSPSGQGEPFVGDIDGTIELVNDRRELVLPHLTARAGAWRLQGRGRIDLSTRAQTEENRGEWLRAIAFHYPRWSGHVARQLARLPDVAGGIITAQLEPGRLHATVRADEIELPPELTSRPSAVRVADLHVGLEAALDDTLRVRGARFRTSVGTIDAGAEGRVRHVTGQAAVTRRRDGKWRVQHAQTRIDGIERDGLALGPIGIDGTLDQWPNVRVGVLGQAFGSAWNVRADGALDRREGDLRIEGRITPEILQLAGRRAGRDLNALLQAKVPPRFDARVSFAAGGRPSRADVRLSAGPVIARNVALDQASGHAFWSPERVHVEDIHLAVGPSEARGTYSMDTGTRDFRFLLSGQLQPAAIDGWFREWWTMFWERFDFGDQTPSADVDIQGRWGHRHETRVFVAAEGEHVKLEGADFDRIRTRLFVRPGWTDVLEFIGEREGRLARGRFSRGWQPGEPGWRSLEFTVQGNLDHEPAPALFDELGRTITAPFTWSEPPMLRVQGHLERDEQDAPIRSDVDIWGEASGPWTFHAFPLHDLRFHARLKNEHLRIGQLEAGFAGGVVTGSVDIDGLRSDRRLGLQLVLNDARLGESIRTVETWSATRHGLPEPPESRFQQKLAPGVLDLSLSASGRFDDPYSLHGSGAAVIEGADLAEINLLGVLSSILRRTIFNFTTLELENAYADFILAGRTLHFHELRLSGRRAAIEATGNYELDTKLLDFNARILPFDASESFLGSTVGAVLTPLSHALEVKLGGRLEQPDWVFLYGPTSLLRAITGGGARSQSDPLFESQDPSPETPSDNVDPTPVNPSDEGSVAPEQP